MIFLCFYFFPLFGTAHAYGACYQASCTYTHKHARARANTRRKTIAAERQSKTHSRTIRIHTLHNFISDKTNGFCMRESRHRWIFWPNVSARVRVCVYARQYHNRCCIFFSSLHFCLYYFCCHWCLLSLLPPPPPPPPPSHPHPQSRPHQHHHQGDLHFTIKMVDPK